MKNLILVLLLFTGGNIAAQEYIGPLKYNRHQESDMKKRAERLRYQEKNARASSMELPFVDDFSTDKFAGNADGEPDHWLDFSAFRNYTYAIDPPTLGIVTFDGADEYGYPYDWNSNGTPVPSDTLTSVPINLNYPASDNIYFSFFYEGRGFGEVPEFGDSLTLEFYAPDLDQWFHAWSVAGTGMSEFEQVFIHITQERYLMDNFQFRFVNYASPLGALDHWHIDYVQLDRNRQENEVIDDVAYRYPVHTILEDYTRMPWKHFIENPSIHMADEVDLVVFNNNDGNRTILDRYTEIYYEGDLQGQNINESNPPVLAQSELVLTEPINSNPFNFVFDTDVNDTAAVFDVHFTHSVTPDNIESNNTVHFQQEFYSYYAHDDGSPEAAHYFDLAGFSGALRFVNVKSDSLIGIAIWFEALNDIPAAGNFAFFPNVWTDSGNGPGSLIEQGPWSSIPFVAGEEHGWRLFQFEAPVYIPAGGFYAGFNQSTTDYLYMGVDMNSNYNYGNWYFNNPNNGYWTPTDLEEGTMMIRPVFQSSKLGPLSVDDQLKESVSVFPNPADEELFIRVGADSFRGEVQVLDLTGKVLLSESIGANAGLSIADFAPGIYLVKITSKDGKSNHVSKFVKR